jgi:hypothetical protein
MFKSLTLAASVALFSSVAQAQVSINEVDADTDGTDILEFVELYDGGVGGTALDGLVVVFVNGSDGVSYNDGFDLDGFTTDVNGYFLLGNAAVAGPPAIIFPSNGLQNGADGVALIMGDGTTYPNDTDIALTGDTLLDFVGYDTNDSDDPDITEHDLNGYGQLNEGANFSQAFHSNQRCAGAVWTAATPTPGAANDCSPANNDCAGAEAVFFGAGAGSFSFDSSFATASGVNPGCGGGTNPNDVWYSWSPDVDGEWRFSTCDMAFDTRLALYDSCAGAPLNCNDDGAGCGGFTSILDVACLSTTATYFVQIGGFNAAVGTGALDISNIGPAVGCTGHPNDECSVAQVIANGAGTTVGLDTTGATASPEASGCDGATAGGAGVQNDMWLSWTADFSGDYDFSTCGLAAFDTNLGLWDSACGAEIACEEDTTGCAGFSTTLNVPGLTGGTTYAIRLGGWGAGESGLTDLDISCTSCTPPANNDCGGATPIVEGANAVANNEPFTTASGVEPSGLAPHVDEATPDTLCDFNQTMNFDSWHSFTATANSGYTFSACGTASYDTKLAIYSGACGALVALSCNDDGPSCTGFTSELNVTGLSEGSTYLVQVGGFNAGEQGTATMNVSRRAGTQNYCTTAANTAGAGAVMGSSGSTSIAADDLTISCSGLPDDFAIFFYGLAKDNTAVTGFNGVQCVSNPVRLQAVMLAAGGMTSRAVTNAELGAPGAGDTLFFQCFYRDNGNLGNGANTSDGLAVTFGL